MAKKYYVVWAGRQTGIFTDWATTKKQVDKFPQAKYKSFPSEQEAQAAFKAGSKTTSAVSTPAKTKLTPAPKAQHDQFQVHIYCDGACEPNPGQASSGVAVYEGEHLTQLWYGLYTPHGTNNTAELNALYQSLFIAKEAISKGQTVQILCDSQYAINSLTNWGFGWKKNGWKKKTGEIKNLDIIQPAHELFCQLEKDVTISHVKAHIGIEGNELADRMAVYGITRQDKSFCRYTEEIDIKQILNFKAG
jgi:ribonuclease HI